MENIFSNKGISEEGKSNDAQQYIYGGVYHKVIIKEVLKHTTNSGTECLRMMLYTEQGGPDTARSFDFYFTPKSAEITKSKLKHIATKVAKESVFENMPANNLDEYIENYGKIVTGKTLRIQFNAEQYQNSNGEIKDVARIGLPVFAEATQPGAEYPPIADEDTALTFDKEDPYNYKKLDISPDNEENLTTGSLLDEPASSGSENNLSWLDNH